MKTFRSLVLVWAFAAMAVVPAFGNMINILAQVDCVGWPGVYGRVDV